MCHGTVQADPDAVGILAARAVEEAIVRGVKAAESLHGRIPFGICEENRNPELERKELFRKYLN